MDYYGPPADPLKIRAVLINTADKWTSQNWDSGYGWGYLNLENAWNQRDDVFRYSIYPEGDPGDFDLFFGTFHSPRETATLVWNRHVEYLSGGDYPTTWYNLNDLDLLAYNHSDGALLDWSISGIDNVEQVFVSADEPMEVVLRVEANDSSFSGVSFEPYGLATPPGFDFPPNLPDIQVSTISDNNLFPEEEYNVTAVVGNAGDFNAVDPIVTLTVPSGHTLIEGTGSIDIGTLVNNEGNNIIIKWTVRAPANDSTGNIDTDVSSTCWGETWTGGDLRTVQVNTTSHQPRIRAVVTSSVSSVVPDQEFDITAGIRNEASDPQGDAEGVSVELTLPVGFEIVGGPNPATIPSLDHGEEIEVVWTAKAGAAISGVQWFRVHAGAQVGSSTLRGTDAGFVTRESTLINDKIRASSGTDSCPSCSDEIEPDPGLESGYPRFTIADPDYYEDYITLESLAVAGVQLPIQTVLKTLDLPGVYALNPDGGGGAPPTAYWEYSTTSQDGVTGGVIEASLPLGEKITRIWRFADEGGSTFEFWVDVYIAGARGDASLGQLGFVTDAPGKTKTTKETEHDFILDDGSAEVFTGSTSGTFIIANRFSASATLSLRAVSFFTSGWAGGDRAEVIIYEDPTGEASGPEPWMEIWRMTVVLGSGDFQEVPTESCPPINTGNATEGAFFVAMANTAERSYTLGIDRTGPSAGASCVSADGGLTYESLSAIPISDGNAMIRAHERPGGICFIHISRLH